MKCAIFDFDGTLFDSMFIWDRIGEVYLRSLGIEPKPSLREDLRPLSLYQSACYFQSEYDLPLSVEEIMSGINRTVADFYIHTVLPKPGVASFLEQLKSKGISMCIATASERDQVEAALRRCRMEHHFEANGPSPTGGRERYAACGDENAAWLDANSVPALHIQQAFSSRGRLLQAKQTLLQDKYTALLNKALLAFYAGEKIEI